MSVSGSASLLDLFHLHHQCGSVSSMCAENNAYTRLVLFNCSVGNTLELDSTTMIYSSGFS